MTDFPLTSLSHAVAAIEVLAVIAFAASGLVAAARARLDVLGALVVAGLAAFGGGTVRDILLDRRPFFWVERTDLQWGLPLFCLAVMALLRGQRLKLSERAMQWPDAVGLGLVTASGTRIALETGAPPLVAVLMGMVTAVVGGVLRDIVCNEVPTAFRDRRPYAVCAFAGGWVMVGAHLLQTPGWLGLFAAAATATLLRAWAMLTDYRLPEWNRDLDRDG